MVTVTAILIRSWEIPSSSSQSCADHRPSGMAATASEAVRAPCSMIRSTVASTTPGPNFSQIWWSRRSPTRMAATWALKSPMMVSGIREL